MYVCGWWSGVCVCVAREGGGRRGLGGKAGGREMNG